MSGSSLIDGRSEVAEFRIEDRIAVQFHDGGFKNGGALVAGWVRVQKTLFSSHCIVF